MSKRVSKAFGVLFLLMELAVVPKAIDLMLNQHLSDMSPLRIVALSMTFGSIALCILMSYSSMSEHDGYPLNTFLFELMVFLCCIAPMTDLSTNVLDLAGRPGLNMLVNTVYYLVGINLAYAILRYEYLIIGADERPKLRKIRKLASCLMVLDNLATLLNIRFGYFFIINESGAYQSAPTFWLSYIAPALIVAATAVTAAKEMRPGRQKKAFLFFWLFALLATALQILVDGLTVQYTGYTLSLIVLYLNIQSELDTSCVKISVREDS